MGGNKAMESMKGIKPKKNKFTVFWYATMCKLFHGTRYHNPCQHPLLRNLMGGGVGPKTNLVSFGDEKNFCHHCELLNSQLISV